MSCSKCKDSRRVMLFNGKGYIYRACECAGPDTMIEMLEAKEHSLQQV